MKLSEKQVAVISGVAAEKAAKAALEYLEKEKQNQEKKIHDRRLRNIKLLLRNYRTFKKHCEDVKADISSLNEKINADFLDSDEFKIQSIIKSKQRTLLMVNYVDKALRVYKSMCQESSDSEDQRRYQVIYEMYITEEKVNADELAIRHYVHKRTIYKDVDNACKTLAVLMFGVDGVRFW